MIKLIEVAFKIIIYVNVCLYVYFLVYVFF
jgi:hypothetical protein